MRKLLAFALAFWPALAASGEDSRLRTHTERIASSRHDFEIPVDGTIDPENLEIAIENAGDAPVVNPRITVNGRYNWYTLEGLVEEITRGARTGEEKAWAIFRFVKEKSYWWSYPRDDSANNPLRHFNVYGYHICSMAAGVYVGLCRAAGLESRVWEIWHHTVAETKWDGAWHHMDADLGVWYLKDDNRTVASMEDLERHPEWVSRSYIPYRWYIGLDNLKRIYSPGAEPGGKIFSPGTDAAGASLADLYATSEDNYVSTGDDSMIFSRQNMNFTLRPDEKLVRWWKPVLNKHYDQGAVQEPPRYANGQIVFEPDFSRRNYAGTIMRRNVKFKGEDGRSPAAHVDRPRDPVHDQPAFLTIPIASPYVIVGGHVDTTWYKGGTGILDRLSLAADLDPVLGERKTLWEFYNWGYGMGETRAELDSKLVRSGPKAAYQIRVAYTLSADKRSEAPAAFPLVYGGECGVDRVRVVADLQLNPDSLPALSRGKNVIHYTDETQGPHALTVTYRWRERFDRQAPEVPAPAGPAGGATGASLAPLLEWAPALHPGGAPIVNYRVQVSLRPDCAWPLSTALDRDVRQGAAFQVPKGWLNAGTTYYWRVRAEDAQGNLGPWSAPRPFTTR